MSRYMNLTIVEVQGADRILARETPGPTASAETVEYALFFKEMNNYFNNDILTFEIHSPKPNEICVALNSQNKKWHRVRVQEILTTLSGAKADCFFLDTGEKQMIQIVKIQKIPKRFLTVPFQVKVFALYGLRPLSLVLDPTMTAFKRPCRKWDKSAAVHIKQLINYASAIQAVIKSRGEENELLAMIYLRFSSNGEILSLNEELINKGYAIKDPVINKNFDDEETKNFVQNMFQTNQSLSPEAEQHYHPTAKIDSLQSLNGFHRTLRANNYPVPVVTSLSDIPQVNSSDDSGSFSSTSSSSLRRARFLHPLGQNSSYSNSKECRKISCNNSSSNPPFRTSSDQPATSDAGALNKLLSYHKKLQQNNQMIKESDSLKPSVSYQPPNLESRNTLPVAESQSCNPDMPVSSIQSASSSTTEDTEMFYEFEGKENKPIPPSVISTNTNNKVISKVSPIKGSLPDATSTLKTESVLTNFLAYHKKLVSSNQDSVPILAASKAPDHSSNISAEKVQLTAADRKINPSENDFPVSNGVRIQEKKENSKTCLHEDKSISKISSCKFSQPVINQSSFTQQPSFPDSDYLDKNRCYGTKSDLPFSRIQPEDDRPISAMDFHCNPVKNSQNVPVFLESDSANSQNGMGNKTDILFNRIQSEDVDRPISAMDFHCNPVKNSQNVPVFLESASTNSKNGMGDKTDILFNRIQSEDDDKPISAMDFHCHQVKKSQNVPVFLESASTNSKNGKGKLFSFTENLSSTNNSDISTECNFINNKIPPKKEEETENSRNPDSTHLTSDSCSSKKKETTLPSSPSSLTTSAVTILNYSVSSKLLSSSPGSTIRMLQGLNTLPMNKLNTCKNGNSSGSGFSKKLQTLTSIDDSDLSETEIDKACLGNASNSQPEKNSSESLTNQKRNAALPDNSKPLIQSQEFLNSECLSGFCDPLPVPLLNPEEETHIFGSQSQIRSIQLDATSRKGDSSSEDKMENLIKWGDQSLHKIENLPEIVATTPNLEQNLSAMDDTKSTINQIDRLRYEGEKEGKADELLTTNESHNATSLWVSTNTNLTFKPLTAASDSDCHKPASTDIETGQKNLTTNILPLLSVSENEDKLFSVQITARNCQNQIISRCSAKEVDESENNKHNPFLKYFEQSNANENYFSSVDFARQSDLNIRSISTNLSSSADNEEVAYCTGPSSTVVNEEIASSTALSSAADKEEASLIDWSYAADREEVATCAGLSTAAKTKEISFMDLSAAVDYRQITSDNALSAETEIAPSAGLPTEVGPTKLAPSIRKEIAPSVGLSSEVDNKEIAPSTGLSSEVDNKEIAPSTGLSSEVDNKEIAPSTGLSSEVDNKEIAPSVGLSSEVDNKEIAPSIVLSSEVDNKEIAPSIVLSSEVDNKEIAPSAGLLGEVDNKEIVPSAGLSSEGDNKEIAPSIVLSSEVDNKEIAPSTGLSSEVDNKETAPSVGLSSEVDNKEIAPSTGLSSEVANIEIAPSAGLSGEVDNEEIVPSAGLSGEGDNKEIAPSIVLSSEVDNKEIAPSTGLSSEVDNKETAPSVGLSSEVDNKEIAPSTGLSSEVDNKETAPSVGLSSEVDNKEIAPSTGLSSEVANIEIAPSAGLSGEVDNEEIVPSAGLSGEGDNKEIAPSIVLSSEVDNKEIAPSTGLSCEVDNKEIAPSAGLSCEVDNKEIVPSAGLSGEGDNKEIAPSIVLSSEVDNKEIAPSTGLSCEVDNKEIAPSAGLSCEVDNKEIAPFAGLSSEVGPTVLASFTGLSGEVDKEMAPSVGLSSEVNKKEIAPSVGLSSEVDNTAIPPSAGLSGEVDNKEIAPFVGLSSEVDNKEIAPYVGLSSEVDNKEIAPYAGLSCEVHNKDITSFTGLSTEVGPKELAPSVHKEIASSFGLSSELGNKEITLSVGLSGGVDNKEIALSAGLSSEVDNKEIALSAGLSSEGDNKEISPSAGLSCEVDNKEIAPFAGLSSEVGPTVLASFTGLSGEVDKEMAPSVGLSSELGNKEITLSVGLSGGVDNKEIALSAGLSSEVDNKEIALSAGLSSEVDNKEIALSAGLSSEGDNKEISPSAGLSCEVDNKEIAPFASLSSEVGPTVLAPFTHLSTEDGPTELAPSIHKTVAPSTGLSSEVDNKETAPYVGLSSEVDNKETAPSVGLSSEVDNIEIAPSAGLSGEVDNEEIVPSAGLSGEGDNKEIAPSIVLSSEVDNKEIAPSFGLSSEVDNKEIVPSVGLSSEVDNKEIAPSAVLSCEVDNTVMSSSAVDNEEAAAMDCNEAVECTVNKGAASPISMVDNKEVLSSTVLSFVEHKEIASSISVVIKDVPTSCLDNTESPPIRKNLASLNESIDSLSAAESSKTDNKNMLRVEDNMKSIPGVCLLDMPALIDMSTDSNSELLSSSESEDPLSDTSSIGSPDDITESEDSSVGDISDSKIESVSSSPHSITNNYKTSNDKVEEVTPGNNTDTILHPAPSLPSLLPSVTDNSEVILPELFNSVTLSETVRNKLDNTIPVEQCASIDLCKSNDLCSDETHTISNENRQSISESTTDEITQTASHLYRPGDTKPDTNPATSLSPTQMSLEQMTKAQNHPINSGVKSLNVRDHAMDCIRGRRILDKLGVTKKVNTTEGNYVESITTESILLNDSVLFVAETIPNPIYNLQEFGVPEALSQLTENLNILPKTIQAYSWGPALRGKNIVGISPPGSGKSWAYIVPIIASLCQYDIYSDIKFSNGPFVLILVSSWNKAISVYKQCKHISRSNREIIVEIVYGGGEESKKSVNLLNGCHILVATLPCFQRMLDSKFTSLDRLCHLVIDDADILLQDFYKEIVDLMCKYKSLVESRDKGYQRHQVMAYSSKWTSYIKGFVKNAINDIVIIITDMMEAAIYGGVKQIPIMCEESDRKDQLVKLVPQILKKGEKVIVFSQDDDCIELQCLLAQLVKNPVAVACNSLYKSELEIISTEWKLPLSEEEPYRLLVSSDVALCDLFINDATCVIHYQMPKKKIHIGLRIQALSNYYQHYQNDQPPVKIVKSYILITPKDKKQVKSLRSFLMRSINVTDKETWDFLSSIRQDEDFNPAKKLCINLKAFGKCRNKYQCDDRHCVVPSVDLNGACSQHTCLPSQGEVRVKILHVKTANNFYVRILEHKIGLHKSIQIHSDLASLIMEMAFYYNNHSNRHVLDELTAGMLCVVNTSEQFSRVKVMKPYDNASKNTASLFFVDIGKLESHPICNLYQLADVFKTIPFQAVEVFLCRLRPVDFDTKWTPASNSFAECWLESKMLYGKIRFVMDNTLWLDPLLERTFLKAIKTVTNGPNLRRELISNNLAVDNPQHLIQLHQLFESYVPKLIPSNNLQSSCSSWEFILENETLQTGDDYENVVISYIFNPGHFYVQKMDMKICLNDIMMKIEEKMGVETKQQQKRDWLTGMHCLSKSLLDSRWYRVIILTLLDSKAVVHFVDYGNIEEVPIDELRTIPRELMYLPSQAIECKLAHIKPFEDQWSAKCNDIMYYITQTADSVYKTLSLRVVSEFSTESKLPQYCVSLLDTTYERVINVGQELVWWKMAAPNDDHFQPLFPEPQTEQMFYPSATNIADMCAVLYYEQTSSQQYAQLMMSYLKVCLKHPEKLIEENVPECLLKLFSYTHNADMFSSVLDYIKLLMATPSLFGNLLSCGILQSLGQILKMHDDVNVLHKTFQLIQFMIKIDTNHIKKIASLKSGLFSILCEILNSFYANEIRMSVCELLESFCLADKKCSENLIQLQVCPLLLPDVLEMQDHDFTEAYLSLLVPISQLDSGLVAIKREKPIEEIMKIIESAKCEKCISNCLIALKRLADQSRKNKTLLLELNAVAIFSSCQNLLSGTEAAKLCQELLDGLIVKVHHKDDSVSFCPQLQSTNERNFHVLWCQNKFRILLTVKIAESEWSTCKFQKTSVHFCLVSNDGINQSVNYELFDEVIVEKCAVCLQNKEVILSLCKTEIRYWPRLLQDKFNKPPNLYVDFDKIEESDDSDSEEVEADEKNLFTLQVVLKKPLMKMQKKLSTDEEEAIPLPVDSAKSEDSLANSDFDEYDRFNIFNAKYA